MLVHILILGGYDKLDCFANEFASSLSKGIFPDSLQTKEKTIKGLFVKVFNRLYAKRTRLLRDYKAKLKSEKFDQERIVELYEEIESLIQQEQAFDG